MSIPYPTIRFYNTILKIQTSQKLYLHSIASFEWDLAFSRTTSQGNVRKMVQRKISQFNSTLNRILLRCMRAHIDRHLPISVSFRLTAKYMQTGAYTTYKPEIDSQLVRVDTMKIVKLYLMRWYTNSAKGFVWFRWSKGLRRKSYQWNLLTGLRNKTVTVPINTLMNNI